MDERLGVDMDTSPGTGAYTDMSPGSRDERLGVYMDTLLGSRDEGLLALEKEARAGNIPIIRRDTQYFLRWLLAQCAPKRILEIGTAVGFSAILMARYSNARIDTIENYAPRITEARANFAKHDEGGQINLLEGDAAEILPTLGGGYDLVFMDAAKGQYSAFWPEVRRLLLPGGVLVCDNVLREGDILESRFVIERRNRTIHKRMRGFLREVASEEGFVTDILPVGDGLCVAVKKDDG